MREQLVVVDCRRCGDLASDYLDRCASAERLLAVKDHLHGCPDCCAFIESLRETVRVLSELREPGSAEDARNKALDSYLSYYPEPERIEGAADLTRVKQLWAQLATLPTNKRVLAVREGGEFVGRPLFEWLLARARRVSNRSPEKAVPLGRLALEIARERQRRFGDTKCLSVGLSGLAWCYVSLRDYRAAKHLLHEAAPLGGAAGDTTRERASYLVARGFYCAETGKAEESQQLLEEALQLETQLGNRRGIVCAYVNLAIPAMNRGDVARALDLYSAAQKNLDAEADPPRLQVMVYSHLVLTLCENGRLEEAAELLPLANDCAERVGGWFWEAYTYWLVGTMERCSGRHQRAMEVFEEVRSEFRARGHLVLYLEASLDLGRTLVAEGRLQELGSLALEMLQVTGELEGDQQIRSSVVCFAEAVRQQTLNSQLLGSLAVALRSMRSRHRPSE